MQLLLERESRRKREAEARLADPALRPHPRGHAWWDDQLGAWGLDLPLPDCIVMSAEQADALGIVYEGEVAMLYEVVVTKLLTKKECEEGEADVIVFGPICLPARNEACAVLEVGRKLAVECPDAPQGGRLEVAIRPFRA
jgi:hypothetical protein